MFTQAGIPADKIPYATVGTGACECITALTCVSLGFVHQHKDVNLRKHFWHKVVWHIPVHPETCPTNHSADLTNCASDFGISCLEISLYEPLF